MHLPRSRRLRHAVPLAALPILLSAAGCSDSSLAINPASAPGQLCAGQFVTGEPFVLCRRTADGALGSFEVFLPSLHVEPSGTILLADKVVVGFAEITQSFDGADDRDAVYWQLKSPDSRLLQLQEIALLPEVTTLIAAGDPEVIEAVEFIDFFVRHYMFNAGKDLAEKNGKVYGIDDFLQCLGTKPSLRQALCYNLYDLAPGIAPDGSLDRQDFKALHAVLSGELAAAEVGNFEFDIDVYFACQDADFNIKEDEPITPQCAGLDTNASGTVDSLDLGNLLLGNVPLNFTPVAFAGEDLDVSAGEVVILNGRASFDVETKNLEFVWDQISGSAVTLVGAETSEASFVAPALISGSLLKFRLTVTDAQGSAAQDIVEIQVQGQSGVSQQVQADAGSNQQVQSGALVTLSAAASSGNNLSYQWLQLVGVPVTLSATDTEQPVFTAPAVGSPTVLRFQLLVSDPSGASDITTVDVTVLPAP